MRTVRSFSSEARTSAQYTSAVEQSYEVGRRLSGAYGLFQGSMTFIPQAAIALVLWWGGTQVIEGALSAGLLTSFLLYTLSMAMAFAFLSALYGDFMAAVGASQRLFQLLDREPEIPSSGGLVPTTPFVGHVEFDQVSFAYPTREDIRVLHDVSLSLEPGKILALVGPSGGGKSTLVALLERFYDVGTGRILVDNRDLRELDPRWYRSHVALVSQEPILFATTIRENITFGVSRVVTEAEIIAAATAANAHSFISGFPEGYDALVGERGVRLSGGQKQRIAIARALIMNPKVLLLDEATSALDAESEHLVQEAIDRAMQDRTVMVIAHRLSTVKNAHSIAVLSGGKVAERGTHDELIQLGGIYKKLVHKQLSGNDASPKEEQVKLIDHE